MPIYEYECKKCGKLMEVLQKASEPGPRSCEKCGSKKVQRVMSQTSFQLKGEGWYVTDYSRKDKEKKAKKKDSEGASDAKADKPAKKASSADSTAS